MKEYTLLAIIAAVIAVLMDSKFKTGILRRKLFYLFLLVIFCFKFLVNGYLTRNIVMYDDRFFLGYRLGTIPLEDFIFGFAMVVILLAVWEFFKRREVA